MNKIDWSKAPEGAEFYADGYFFKTTNSYTLAYSRLLKDWINIIDNASEKLRGYYRSQPDYQQRPKESQMKHYKGQMTKEQLQGTKIRIQSPEHSEAFQNMCFAAGGKWVLGREVISSGVRFIFIRYYCGLVLKHSTSEDNFLNSDCTEITWEPEPKATKTTKNPNVSLRIQSSNGRMSE